jgi:hypothetical protein
LRNLDDRYNIENREFARGKISMIESFCAPMVEPVSTIDMEHEEWQMRARNAGLKQQTLALLAGVTPTTASLQLRGLNSDQATPIYIRTIVRAWEMLTPEQRDELRQAAQDDRP